MAHIPLPTPDPMFILPPRTVGIVLVVLLGHALALWALQAGLIKRMDERPIPVQVAVELIQPPQPEPEPAPAAVQAATPRSRPAPLPPTVAKAVPSPATPATRTGAPPQAVATAPASTISRDTLPAPGPVAPAPLIPPAPAISSGPGMVAPAPATATAAPSPPRVELPTSSADYLNNPSPPYPPLSKRLGEQGRVVVRVMIEADGTASSAELRQSSGFDRLDQTALQTVLRWRYVPGKRAGVPEAMWANIPVNFVLE